MWGSDPADGSPLDVLRRVHKDGLGAALNLFAARYGALALVAASVALTVGAAANEVLDSGPPALSADSAVWMHGGWYVTVGGVPYVDFFDVKPPLSVELNALLAAVAGGDPWVQYLLTVALMGGAVTAIVVLVGALVVDLTDDAAAGLLAGVVVLGYPFFFYYVAKGFRAKTLALALGLGAVYLAIRGRGRSAGACAAAAAGLWQLAVFFPAATLLCLSRGAANGRSWKPTVQVRNMLVMMAAVTAAVVGPILLLGAGRAMVVGAVVIPLQDGQGQSVVYGVLKAVALLGFATIPVLLGVSEAVRNGTERVRTWVAGGAPSWSSARFDGWWLPAGVGFYALQVYIDLDYYPDLFQIVALAGVGVGVTVARLRRDHVATVAVLLVVILVFNSALALTLGPFAGYRPLATADRTAVAMGVETPATVSIAPRHGPYYNVSQGEFMNQLYWERQIPEYCHYRFSTTERKWLERTNRTYRSPCGVLPADR